MQGNISAKISFFIGFSRPNCNSVIVNFHCGVAYSYTGHRCCFLIGIGSFNRSSENGTIISIENMTANHDIAILAVKWFEHPTDIHYRTIVIRKGLVETDAGRIRSVFQLDSNHHKIMIGDEPIARQVNIIPLSSGALDNDGLDDHRPYVSLIVCIKYSYRKLIGTRIRPISTPKVYIDSLNLGQIIRSHNYPKTIAAADHCHPKISVS